MQTVFEIFDSRDGKAQGFRHTERKALETCTRIGGSMDYLPASAEGFYVVDMLEISEAQAKARIAAQRQHMLAHPMQDLSWEYDL
jgi:hypothetical protein